MDSKYISIFNLNPLLHYSDTLEEHLNRVIYPVGKRAHTAEPVSSYGWTHSKNGEMISHRTIEEILPVQFVDVLDNFECESNNDNDEDNGDLNKMSTDTENCDKDSYEDFQVKLIRLVKCKIKILVSNRILLFNRTQDYRKIPIKFCFEV